MEEISDPQMNQVYSPLSLLKFESDTARTTYMNDFSYSQFPVGNIPMTPPTPVDSTMQSPHLFHQSLSHFGSLDQTFSYMDQLTHGLPIPGNTMRSVPEGTFSILTY